MLHVIIFVLFAQAAFSLDSFDCKDGQEIPTQIIKNPDDLIGNWSYIYHWDSDNKFNPQFANFTKHNPKCPEIEISPIEPEIVKKSQEVCEKQSMPFKWEDAKLKLTAPLMNIKDGIIFFGEKDNWLVVGCKKMIRVKAKKVSHDIIVMINPDVAHISELMTRKPLKLSELECLTRNVDVGKGLQGIGLCQ